MGTVDDRSAARAAVPVTRCGLPRWLGPAPDRGRGDRRAPTTARGLGDRVADVRGCPRARRGGAATAAPEPLGRALRRDRVRDPGDPGGPSAVPRRRSRRAAGDGARRAGGRRDRRRGRLLARPPPRSPAPRRARDPRARLRGGDQPRPPRRRPAPGRAAAGARRELALDHPSPRLPAGAGAGAHGRGRRDRATRRIAARFRAPPRLRVVEHLRHRGRRELRLGSHLRPARLAGGRDDDAHRPQPDAPVLEDQRAGSL